jgi:hypothetical protein
MATTTLDKTKRARFEKALNTLKSIAWDPDDDTGAKEDIQSAMDALSLALEGSDPIQAEQFPRLLQATLDTRPYGGVQLLQEDIDPAEAEAVRRLHELFPRPGTGPVPLTAETRDAKLLSEEEIAALGPRNIVDLSDGGQMIANGGLLPDHGLIEEQTAALIRAVAGLQPQTAETRGSKELTQEAVAALKKSRQPHIAAL